MVRGTLRESKQSISEIVFSRATCRRVVQYGGVLGVYDSDVPQGQPTRIGCRNTEVPIVAQIFLWAPEVGNADQARCNPHRQQTKSCTHEPLTRLPRQDQNVRVDFPRLERGTRAAASEQEKQR